MTTVHDDVLAYPHVESDALDVDASFRELQRRGPEPYPAALWAAVLACHKV